MFSRSGAVPGVRHAPAVPAVVGLLATGLLSGLLAACSIAAAVPGTTTAAATADARPSAARAPSSPARPSGPSSSSAPLATAVLAGLAVKGRAPMTGYRRALFGADWADEDHDGCSTREEILQRDLTGTTRRASGRCAVVVTGTLADPYSGRRIAFQRGESTSSLVQIDHVVAVGDAWQKGAQQLTPARRLAFYNDPLNLLAVEGHLNQSKGDGDAATWLPPSTAYRCSYVARQVAVKARYGLWVTTAEKAAIGRILATCPDRRVPTG